MNVEADRHFTDTSLAVSERDHGHSRCRKIILSIQCNFPSIIISLHGERKALYSVLFIWMEKLEYPHHFPSSATQGLCQIHISPIIVIFRQIKTKLELQPLIRAAQICLSMFRIEKVLLNLIKDSTLTLHFVWFQSSWLTS